MHAASRNLYPAWQPRISKTATFLNHQFCTLGQSNAACSGACLNSGCKGIQLTLAGTLLDAVAVVCCCSDFLALHGLNSFFIRNAFEHYKGHMGCKGPDFILVNSLAELLRAHVSFMQGFALTLQVTRQLH
jgi:hypothetical protein